MNLKELLEVLDIESPEEFLYFENLADLMEYDGAVEPEPVYALLSGMDRKVLPELLDNYFEELLESVPAHAIDLYTLLNTIKLALSGLSLSADEEHERVLLADELCRFRDWYAFDSASKCRSVDSARDMVLPVKEALVLHRMEKLNEGEYIFDFDECMDYPLKDYMMSFAEIVGTEEDDEIKTQEGELRDGFVYDDEFRDEAD